MAAVWRLGIIGRVSAATATETATASAGSSSIVRAADDAARAYADGLLGDLRAEIELDGETAVARHPALEWAASGAMALTGAAAGPPALAPAPIASCARGTLAALRAINGSAVPDGLDATALLGERAAIFGHRRRGAISAGGSCRLLRAADGWIAVNLARDDDLRALPAWLGDAGDNLDPWRFVEARVAYTKVAELLERARLLALAVAPLDDPALARIPWVRVQQLGRRVPEHRRAHPPLVVDLSSLWAGPLAASLLAMCGARVIKVESTRRPDGARRGPQRFFDLLNAGKESVALDLASPDGVRALQRLLSRADIVVEASRPRALEQLGICARELLERRTGLTWLSITGYGRAEPRGEWGAFGDDAAAAGGLVARGAHGAPWFCGDAIADPLGGLHGALAAWVGWRGGGGGLIDLALAGVCARIARLDNAGLGASASRRGDGGWEVCAGGERQPVRAPRARASSGRARELGADTAAVVSELATTC